MRFAQVWRTNRRPATLVKACILVRHPFVLMFAYTHMRGVMLPTGGTGKAHSGFRHHRRLHPRLGQRLWGSVETKSMDSKYYLS